MAMLVRLIEKFSFEHLSKIIFDEDIHFEEISS